MNASVLTSTKLPGISLTTPLLPAEFVTALQSQVAQQGDVIRDLRHQLQRWVVEGAEWNRSKLDMRQLVDLQKGEVVRLRGEVVNAMTRAEKAEENCARMAESAKKAAEREVGKANECAEREAELRRALEVARKREVELNAALEKEKETGKGVQAELVQMKGVVEREGLIIIGVHDEYQKLQAKVETLEGQRTQVDERHESGLREAMDRILAVEDEKAKQIRELEDEKMRVYGELQAAKAESAELKKRNQVLEERFTKRADEVW